MHGLLENVLSWKMYYEEYIIGNCTINHTCMESVLENVLVSGYCASMENRMKNTDLPGYFIRNCTCNEMVGK